MDRREVRGGQAFVTLPQHQFQSHIGNDRLHQVGSVKTIQTIPANIVISTNRDYADAIKAIEMMLQARRMLALEVRTTILETAPGKRRKQHLNDLRAENTILLQDHRDKWL